LNLLINGIPALAPLACMSIIKVCRKPAVCQAAIAAPVVKIIVV
jgi:hypothetical protein